MGRPAALARAGVLVLLSSLLQVPAAHATADQPDERSASVAARKSGQPVEVMSLRSETRQVFANPKGTFTATLSPRPVRVRQNGTWVPVDMSLRFAPDGSVTPAAAPLGLRLKGRDAGKGIVTMSTGGHELTLGWREQLPVPALDGSTATYPDVLPGVDLRVQVSVDGFSEVLVVKNREAAAGPALRKITFDTATKGLTLRKSTPGAFDAVDASGKVVLGSSKPMMWDARTKAAMPLDLAPGTLTVTPDQQRLIGADVTYPVYIDPAATLGSANWTMENQRHPDQSYWSYDRDQHAKVGYVSDARDGWERYRSMWTVPMESMAGKHIYNAWFSSYLTHSFSCADTYTDLYLVEPIGPETTWNNHATRYGPRIAEASNSDCKDAGRYSEWSGQAVVDAAVEGARTGSLSVGLVARDEGVLDKGWKKFDENRTALSVEYNTPPDAPDQLSVDNKPCFTDQPIYVGTTTPTLRARPRDEDGDPQDTWFAWGERPQPGGEFVSWFDTRNEGVPASSVTQAQVSPALRDGARYGFQSQSSDGRDEGAKSEYCEFVVDTTRPASAPVVRTLDGRYPDDGQVHGGIGVSGTFSLAANGVDDVVGYLYGLANPPVTYVPADRTGGTATAAATPEQRNGNVLYVQSVDRAGNTSPATRYEFRAGPGASANAEWSADEKSGAVLADSSGNGHPLQLLSGVRLGAPGRTPDGPTAMSFDGTGDGATSSVSVVSSAASFGVTAWVRLTEKGGSDRTIMAQDGTHTSPFLLHYDTFADRWAFRIAHSDEEETTTTGAYSQDPPKMGVWTHLTGTYDAATRKVALFVDGRLADEEISPTPAWQANGPFTVGRAKAYGVVGDRFAGDIDDVRVWNRRVYPAEATDFANALTLAGEWHFDEASGTTAADTSGFGRTLGLSGGQSRIAGPRGNALSCNGTTGFGKTQSRPLLTDTSFTVSAWARTSTLSRPQAVLAVDGVHGSGFYLQYDVTSKRWAFRMNAEDGDFAEATFATALDKAVANQWVHLTGVYDAGAKQIRLYVNGNLASTATLAHAWQAGGVLTVCRSKSNGVADDYLNGAVDDVRVFSGVANDFDAAALYQA